MLEYLNEIEAQLLIWLPTIMSFLLSTVIPFVMKALNAKHTKNIDNQMTELRKEVAELKTNLGAVLNENAALKKTLNKTLTKMDHVYRTEEE